MKGAILAFALLLAAPAVHAAEPPKPLFASDEPIRLTIRGPIKAVAASRDRSRQVAATLTTGAENLPIRLSPRGITRLRKETCQFPPLRVDFAGAPPAASLFAGQRRLKLVTHCKASEGFQQHLLLEYAAYRLYNQMTPASFRVRLAHVDYVEEDGKPLTSRLGFFIEDISDVAGRNGGQEARAGSRIPVAQLSHRDAGRAAVFEYMIGNLDFAMNAGPAGDNCCHNFRLVAAGASLIPVPYDFDFSGFVDAPYALPPEQIRVRSVRERHYRGFCRHNASALAAAAEFRAQRPGLTAVLAQIPQLSDGTRRKASAYLDGFFTDIADDQTVTARLFKTCIG